MENVNEKLNEVRKYEKALLIIDVDSLAGQNISESSGFG
jgi:hypothetical protein